MKIITVEGEAGSGKSTKIRNMILNQKDFVVCTATHSALDNIYSKCKFIDPLIDRNKFKTIYSYFRINFKKEKILGPLVVNSYIFIDEFSLITKELFEKMMGKIKDKNCTVVVAGDLLQLNGIIKGEPSIKYSELTEIIKTHDISEVTLPAIAHYQYSPYSSDYIQKGEIIHLSVNHRAKSTVSEIIGNLFNKNEEYPYRFLALDESARAIANGAIFIASNYDSLQFISDHCYDRGYLAYEFKINQRVSLRVSYKRLYLSRGQMILLSTTADKDDDYDYFNNELVKFIGVEDKDSKMIEYSGEILELETNQILHLVCEKSDGNIVKISRLKDVEKARGNYYFPISPSNFISIHKAQGQGFNKVIVDIDNLFDISMLYTSVTRARDELYFYTKDYSKWKNNLFRDIDSINYLKSLRTPDKSTDFIDCRKSCIS